MKKIHKKSIDMNQAKNRLVALIAALITSMNVSNSEACTRVLYETGTDTYIRSMDWNDLKMGTDLWIFPKGMQRDGGVGVGSIT